MRDTDLLLGERGEPAQDDVGGGGAEGGGDGSAQPLAESATDCAIMAWQGVPQNSLHDLPLLQVFSVAINMVHMKQRRIFNRISTLPAQRSRRLLCGNVCGALATIGAVQA